MPSGIRNGMLKVFIALSVISYIPSTKSMNDQLMPGSTTPTAIMNPEITRKI